MSKIQNILLLSFERTLISTTVYLYTDIVCFPLTQLTYKKRSAVVQFEEEAGKELPQRYTICHCRLIQKKVIIQGNVSSVIFL